MLNSSYIRLVGLAAALTWVASISLLLAQTWLVDDPLSPPALHLWHWSMMTGLVALGLTLFYIAAWLARAVGVADNIAELLSLADRLPGGPQRRP